MEISFLKMQSCGSDYILVNCFSEKFPEERFLPELARKICNRNFGVGGNGLVLIMPGERHGVKIRFFSIEGFETEVFADAIHCVGRYAYDSGLVKEKKICLEILTGDINLEVIDSNNLCLDVGPPYLFDNSGELKEQTGKEYNASLIIDEKEYTITPLSMGSPHTVVFVKDFNFPVNATSKKIEHHPMFPDRTNVEFVRLINKEEIQIRIWKRGVGESLSCAVCASAAVVAAALNGFSDREVTVHSKGGDLFIEWSEKDNHIFVTGSALYVFSGSYYFEEGIV
jgi:diaminopimelate epimerase